MRNLVTNKVKLKSRMKSNKMRFQFTQILDYSFSCSSDFYFPVHHHFIETKHNKLVLNSQSVIYVAVHSYARPESSQESLYSRQALKEGTQSQFHNMIRICISWLFWHKIHETYLQIGAQCKRKQPACFTISHITLIGHANSYRRACIN